MENIGETLFFRTNIIEKAHIQQISVQRIVTNWYAEKIANSEETIHIPKIS